MRGRTYLLAGLTVGLVVLLVVVGVTPLGAPRAEPASAPATEFSAARAAILLREIASAPRPTGSAAAARTRELIYARLAALDLGPRVQATEVVSARDPRVAGTVHNVIGRLPGRDPSRALLLVAHYDSVPASPGAADDGSGVATLLETARALRAGSRPRNDIIFLFTDGEELGLLGAQAFLRDDPVAFAVGLVLSFDSAGSSSPALMYETGPDDGLLVREYVAGGDAYTSSLLYEASRRQTIVSDFRAFLAHGVSGMSFGMLDGRGYDHTAYDSFARLDVDSLQHQGDTALATARRLGDLDLWHAHGPDVVWFDVVDGVAVVYSSDLVSPLTGLAAALYVVAVGACLRRRLLSRSGVSWAALGTGATLGVSMLTMAIVWAAYRTAYEERLWSQTGVVISDLYRVGLVLLAAAVVIAAYGALLRRMHSWDLAVVALAWWLVGALATAILAPGASFLFTWPLIAASLGLIVAGHWGRRATASWGGVAAALAGAAPGIVLMSSATYLLLMSAGLKQVVTVIAVWLVAGLLIPPLTAAWAALRFWLPAGLAVAGAVVLFIVGSTVAFDSEHPKFTSVCYRETEGGAAVWQTMDRPDEYTRPFLRVRPRSPFRGFYFPRLGMRQTLVGEAPDLDLRHPALTVMSDTTDGEVRMVRLRVRPRRRVAVVSLLVHTVVGRLAASVDGRPLEGTDTTILDGTSVRWAFDYYAPPAEGIVVTLRFAAGRPALLRAVDLSYGLPAAVAGRYPARPAGMLPGRLGDAALTETTLRLPPKPAAGAGSRAAARASSAAGS